MGLQALGFSEYEARIYLALLKTHPATAYELSKAANVPRSNTYGTLESLTKKDIVQPVSQQPTRYVAVEPPLVFGRIARDTSERCKTLVERLEHVREEPESHFVWSVAGEANVHAKISEMMAGAAQHIWIKAGDDMLERHLADLEAASGRGVAAVIILFGSRPERFRIGERVQVFLHDGTGLRLGCADSSFTLTTDFTAALIANLAGDFHGAYTQSRPIVNMADTIIRHDVYMAEILGRFRDQIESAFGPHLLTLRQDYFAPEQRALMRERLATRPDLSDDGPKPGPPRARARHTEPKGRPATRRRSAGR